MRACKQRREEGEGEGVRGCDLFGVPVSEKKLEFGCSISNASRSIAGAWVITQSCKEMLNSGGAFCATAHHHTITHTQHMQHMQHSQLLKRSTAHHSTAQQHNTAQHSTAQPQHNTTQHDTATAQHSTTQHSHSTAQRSTAQHKQSSAYQVFSKIVKESAL